MQVSLRLAAAALVAGGLVLGAAPMPLATFGCQPALSSSEPLDQTIEVVIACAEARSERQAVVGVLVTAGVAALAASSPWRRRVAPGKGA